MGFSFAVMVARFSSFHSLWRLYSLCKLEQGFGFLGFRFCCI